MPHSTTKYTVRKKKQAEDSRKNEKCVPPLKGDGAFLAAAPQLWNNLTLNMNTASTYDGFECLHETHFFIVACGHR